MVRAGGDGGGGGHRRVGWGPSAGFYWQWNDQSWLGAGIAQWLEHRTRD